MQRSSAMMKMMVSRCGGIGRRLRDAPCVQWGLCVPREMDSGVGFASAAAAAAGASSGADVVGGGKRGSSRGGGGGGGFVEAAASARRSKRAPNVRGEDGGSGLTVGRRRKLPAESDGFGVEDGNDDNDDDDDNEDDFAGETDTDANVAALAEVISRAKRSQQRYLVEQMLKGPPGGGVGPYTSLQQQYGETLRQFDSSVIDVSRTAKVTKAGAVFRYRALVVVGNKAGMVGFGIAKAKEVAVATNKAEAQALKNLFYIDLYNGHTIHHDMQTRFGRTKLKMFARPNGSGIKVREHHTLYMH